MIYTERLPFDHATIGKPSVNHEEGDVLETIQCDWNPLEMFVKKNLLRNLERLRVQKLTFHERK